MTARNTAGAQRARLKRTSLAVAGAAVSSLVMVLLFARGSTSLSTGELGIILSIFWLVNLGFVLAIASNLNLRFKDPSMTMMQMMWATISIFTMACFVGEGRHLLLMIYLLAMTFGSFRLNTAQHFLVAFTALACYAMTIVCTAMFAPVTVNLATEALNWIVFSLVLVGFSVVGGEAGRLRATLVRRNRELHTAQASSMIANEAKSRFLASTSHELRTPLNAMLGATDIVDDAALDPAQRNALDRARSAGKYLLSLVNTMLDLSRIETGALQIHSQSMTLNEELDTLRAIMLPDAQLRGVELNLDKEGLPEDPVMGDPMRLQAVLLHLLKVAICSAGVRRVTVRACRTAPDKPVRFRVAGTGSRAVHSSPSNGDEALEDKGFNLDLCQTLVTLMGGASIESVVEGNDTRYEFELTMRCAPRQPSLPPAPDAPRQKVLIVDDSIDNQLLLQAYLRDQPWDLCFAEDGIEAVEEARQQVFELILMDMHMPRMNGIDATRIIRKMEEEDPRRPAAKILAITADDSVNSHQRSLDAGCNEHLVKPVSKKILLQAVERVSFTREVDVSR